MSVLNLTPCDAGQPNWTSASEKRTLPVITRFGEAVDVRHRGALRIRRFTDGQNPPQETPAVVRLWMDGECHELSTHHARALAAQLIAAATLADAQNESKST
jgi:fermentation-respiration switch protein FrsA (DUF1100 family)